MRYSLFLLVLVIIFFSGCKKDVVAQTQFFARGADIGWLSEMEAAGIKFYPRSGKADDCIRILKDLGMNTIRLRVWVDPKDGWCGKDDVVRQAIRAHKLGMKLMIDFHYSDWWADPGKQNKPAAWVAYSTAELSEAISKHTVEVLTALKQNGVSPAWVQVGNETNDGMLWETGRASKNMKIFATMVNAGYDGVKQVFPEAGVIVHISNGYDNALFRWMFDGLKTHSAKYDVIGMSLYPEPAKWKEVNDQVIYNMNDMITRYDKPVMMCEIGLPVDQAEAAKLCIEDLISRMKKLPQQKGLGVIYWEPECHNSWKGYNMGAFDNSGRPTVALDAFADQ